MNETNRILILYGVLLASVIAISIITPTAQMIAAIGIYGTLFASYVMRKMHHIDDIVTNHMIYISRTIWIWTLFLFFGVLGIVILILLNGDWTEINHMSAQIMSGAGTPDEAATTQSMQKFSADNEKLVIFSLIICILPAQIYALWRIYKGVVRAKGGYRIQRPQNWF